MDKTTHQDAADIIIPVFNQYRHTRNLLEGIYRYTDYPFHLYVIDNASTDETVDLDKIYTRQITVVRNRENRGWCGAANQGIRLGSSRYVVFMNNAVEVSQDWLGPMIAFLETHPRIGAVGPLDSSPDDWQCADRVRETMVPQIPQFLTDDPHERNQILKYHFHRTGILVEGTLAFFCCALRRRTIDEVGLLEEALKGDGDDSDYCGRLRRAGFVLGLSLESYVVHHSGGTGRASFVLGQSEEFHRRNLERLRQKGPA
jgi:GT2 family glycosyltransferase